MKKACTLLISGLLCCLISIIIAFFATTNPYLSLLKCCLLAYGIVLLTIGCLTFHHKQHTFEILYYIGLVLLCVYTILALDTYIFHAITWYPGMFRYALFSTYGIFYIVFMIPGFCLYYGKKCT
ncbi:MAG: hypothetical protein RR537_01250 [Longicatena sp.]